VNFSEEALSSLDTYHHLNAGQILTTTDVPFFFTYQSLRMGSQGSEYISMDYQCLQTYYDACRERSVRRISSNHNGSSGINCGLHSWLLAVTSAKWISQKVVFCVSSNPGVIMIRIIGLYYLTATFNLLLLLLMKFSGCGSTFQGLKI